MTSLSQDFYSERLSLPGHEYLTELWPFWSMSLVYVQLRKWL